MATSAKQRVFRLSRGGKAALIAAVLAWHPFQSAFGLITGGTGNDPISDPGWPKGAAAIFNNPTRVAHWVGPPFGGGQWHAECRGDAQTFNAVLKEFAALDVPTKELVVHDGVGRSIWLNINREPAKEKAARVDWVFEVWQPSSWERVRKMPAMLVPQDVAQGGPAPPTRIDVYVGGAIRWSDVTVPDGIEVLDERLETHGFSLADGVVLEGDVTDAVSKAPVAATRVKLERIERQSQGGYQYELAAETITDAKGHWAISKAPAGLHRVVIDAHGYVPRIIGHRTYDESPRWHSFNASLARPATVSGRVTDGAGAPLADVVVRLWGVVASDGQRYESPQDYTTKSDADGRFTIDAVPVGKSTVQVSKAGYVRPGLGPEIETPAKNVKLRMTGAAQAQVTVKFTGARSNEYIVELTPEGGNKIGSWGGSAQIDETNSYTFSGVPPGRYVVTGRPNPFSQGDQTEPLAVELKAGEALAVQLQAK